LDFSFFASQIAIIVVVPKIGKSKGKITSADTTFVDKPRQRVIFQEPTPSNQYMFISIYNNAASAATLYVDFYLIA